MACHNPSLKKVKKQGEMSLPILRLIPSLNPTVYNWDGTEDGHWYFPLFLCFLYDRPSLNPLSFLEKILVCIILRNAMTTSLRAPPVPFIVLSWYCNSDWVSHEAVNK